MSLLPTLGISFLLCGIIPNFSSSYNVTITNVKDATSYRHGVRPIEKTLSRTTNGISEISFAFLNIIPVGKIIEDINVSISFENVSRIDFEKSFSHHVVNHKTNMVLTDLTERIHIYLNSSEQYLLINDLCELKCSNMTYCLTLNLTCRIQSEDMDTSSMSAILSTSWTEPFCDFDNQCFLEYEGQFYMSDNGTEGRCNICMTLPRTEHISDIPPKVCTKTEYQCHSGQCINNHTKCDMIQDCFHGDDEAKELCNGEILFINGSKCNEKGHVDVDVDMKSPIFLSDGHGTCKMHFSYIMNVGILRVDLCEIRSNDTEDCSKRIGVFNIERQWLSTDVYLPLEKARYRIRIRGIIFENHEDLFIGLDAIYFEGNCFINKLPGISKKPRTDNSVVIVVSILAGILGLCLILIILKVRQMSRNEKSTQCGLPLFCASLRSDESLDTMSSFIGGNSVNSPLYTSIEEYEKVQSDIHSIARHKLTVQRLLGKGAFGEVYYGLLADVAHSEVPTPVAVKTLPTLCSDQTKLDFFMEAVMLRDLATRNCLLSEKGSRTIVKVGDFGMSRLTGRTNYYRKKGTALVPVKWMSPEAFIDGVFTSKTDVWSYGVLLWEVFSLGHVPYPGKSNEEVMQFVKHGGWR
ncbi:ALK [Mytilus edulis]|uniref:ALK n=1 Tax=Mytilus edulis TaxID=6550 RepID=A0A8S3VD88_MYTED|nr:ALK [Mytilus edulis]